jgi:hypothetical protein
VNHLDLEELFDIAPHLSDTAAASQVSQWRNSCPSYTRYDFVQSETLTGSGEIGGVYVHSCIK